MVFNKDLEKQADANAITIVTAITTERKRTRKQLVEVNENLSKQITDVCLSLANFKFPIQRSYDLEIASINVRLDSLNEKLNILIAATNTNNERVQRIVSDTTLEAKVLKATVNNQVDHIRQAMDRAMLDIPMDTYNVPLPEAQGQA